MLGKWNHYSDCALHNAPALAPGRCDCGNTERQPFNAVRNLLHWLYWGKEYRAGRT